MFGTISFTSELRAWISDASKLYSSSMSAILVSPFQILLVQHTSEEHSKFLCNRTGGVLTCLLEKGNGVGPWSARDSLFLHAFPNRRSNSVSCLSKGLVGYHFSFKSGCS